MNLADGSVKAHLSSQGQSLVRGGGTTDQGEVAVEMFGNFLH